MAALLRRAVRPFAGSSIMGARRSMAIDAKVVRYTRFGAPQNVLQVTEESVSEDLGESQVLIRMVAAPITPNDLTQVKGFSAGASSGVAGNEGLGVVQAVGSAVTNVSVNDQVMPAGTGFGTWRTHAVVEAGDVSRVNAADVAPEVAAASIVAPGTARRLLSDFADLNEGDVIIQNNAGSTVGQAVVQLAASKGVKTINIMRARNDWDDFVNHMHGLGATIVVTEDFARTSEFTKLVADLPAPKLGLNSVGGKSVRTVASTLGEGATLVSFGGMESSDVSVPLSTLVEKDITVRGFNFSKWMENASPADREAVVEQALDDARTESVRILLAREPFGDFEHALKRSLEAGERKVVLVM